MKVLRLLLFLFPVIGIFVFIYLWKCPDCAYSYMAASPPATSRIYRTDYIYNQKTNAFYKLHIDEAYIHRAKDLCSLEGAKLLTVVSDDDLRQVHAMIKKYPDIEHVWIGDDKQEHPQYEDNVVVFGSSYEATSSDYYSYSEPEDKCEVINKVGKVMSLDCSHSYTKYPFICKVGAKDATYDENCNVYDTGYQYYAASGSCYKIPRVPLTWNAAYADCHAVGSHLVVVNSEAESQALREVMRKAPTLRGSKHNSYFIAGFRTRGMTRDFYTIFNQTLEEAGFAQWTEFEPNNLGSGEYCGSLLWDGKLNDINCNEKFGFICEKEKRR